ncbi:DNA topoisomerase 3-alpha [Desmophyllum pertusum]|uniref:DNA topoisomerase n=1 Tax=Desmophyllum pertusum TaxID=174260 RepID=A0A9W9YJY5_9CNID|nr:DNA topoisomerase 3-alpha [Desmophyllum pertusum]
MTFLPVLSKLSLLHRSSVNAHVRYSRELLVLFGSSRRLWQRGLIMRPLRILNVAEKNDAAKELSRIMSRGQSLRREGFSKFNKIYEFDYNILGSNAKMVMTSLSGHMMSLDFTASHQKWHSCAPVALFSAPVTKHVGENYLPIKRTLEREVRGCQVLIIWTDCDREGENIGFEVIDVCQSIRPNIRLYRAQGFLKSLLNQCQELPRTWLNLIHYSHKQWMLELSLTLE